MKLGAILAVIAVVLLTACDEGADTAPVTGTPALAGSPPALASATTAAPPATRSPAPAALTPEQVAALAKGMALAADSAKATLAVWVDFQCPFCLAYTLRIEPTILREYVATGKLRYEVHNLPILGLESVAAAVGAYCVGQQGKFWLYHDHLFALQAEAGQLQHEQLNVGRFSADRLRGLATEVGADRAAFDACFTADATLAAVQDDINAARTLGLSGTPGVVLNGRPIGVGPPSLAEWRTTLDAAIAATP